MKHESLDRVCKAIPAGTGPGPADDRCTDRQRKKEASYALNGMPQISKVGEAGQLP
jgi:hypothetical protein